MVILSVAGKTGVEWTSTTKIIPCHLLMYLHLLDSPSTIIISKYGTVSMPGHYVLVHSVAENVFQDVPKTPLYTTKYKDFLVDQNVRLICGWGKKLT